VVENDRGERGERGFRDAFRATFATANAALLSEATRRGFSTSLLPTDLRDYAATLPPPSWLETVIRTARLEAIATDAPAPPVARLAAKAVRQALSGHELVPAIEGLIGLWLKVKGNHVRNLFVDYALPGIAWQCLLALVLRTLEIETCPERSNAFALALVFLVAIREFHPEFRPKPLTPEQEEQREALQRKIAEESKSRGLDAAADAPAATLTAEEHAAAESICDADIPGLLAAWLETMRGFVKHGLEAIEASDSFLLGIRDLARDVREGAALAQGEPRFVERGRELLEQCHSFGPRVLDVASDGRTLLLGGRTLAFLITGGERDVRITSAEARILVGLVCKGHATGDSSSSNLSRLRQALERASDGRIVLLGGRGTPLRLSERLEATERLIAAVKGAKRRRSS
jgi:hypothetical protein